MKEKKYVGGGIEKFKTLVLYRCFKADKVK